MCLCFVTIGSPLSSACIQSYIYIVHIYSRLKLIITCDAVAAYQLLAGYMQIRIRYCPGLVSLFTAAHAKIAYINVDPENKFHFLSLFAFIVVLFSFCTVAV